jgi:phage terminase large subunit-like protein
VPPPIFTEQANQALAVFKQLKIVDAPGSPTFGESCAPWVFDLVASVFGAYDKDSGRRLITEWFILIPKKNAKSTIAAGIMMTALILNWRQSGEFTVIAPTIEVAGNAFSPARDMVQKDDELEDLMHIQSHVRTILHRGTNASLKVVAADSNTVSGKKSIGTLIEELWLFGKQAGAEAMFREAIGGLASRPEGFVIYVTTQSDDPPAGVFKQKLQYARDVRDGKIIDKGFVPIIFEHPDDMVASGEHLKVENMAMVNPNLGFSVDNEFLRREFRKAEMEGGDSFRGFLAKHGNVEIGMNLRSDAWPGAEYWPDCKYPLPVTLERLLADCEVITIGVDAGGLSDLAAIAVLGRIKNTQNWLLWTKAYAHPSVLERHKQIASRLQDFAKDGDLVLVDRIGQDVESIADVCSQVYASGLLDRIGVDPAGIGSILEAIDAQEIPADRVIGISQGWRLNSAIKSTERKLAEGGLLHGGSAMMNWCAGNARVEARGNAILITKQSSGAGKIDPLIASFCAVSLMALNPQSAGEAYQMFVL